MASEWHAVKALEDAFEKTNNLLFKKFNLKNWLKLALIIFLITGGLGLNYPGSFTGDNKNQNMDFLKDITLIVVIVVVLLVIGLILSFIRSVAQFMFIESLLTGNVELIKGFKRNIDSGLNLFLFNLVFGGIVFAFIIALVIIAIIFGAGLSVALNPIIMFAVIAVVILVILVLMIVINLITTLTNDFAIVIMHKERKGMVNAWKKLIQILKKNAKQVLVYFVLKIAIAVIASIVELIIFVILLIAYVLIIIAAALIILLIVKVIGITSPEKNLILLIPAIIALIVSIIIATYVYAVIITPIYVFFRYYSLLFLEKIEPSASPKAETKVEEKKEPEAKKKQAKRKLKV